MLFLLLLPLAALVLLVLGHNRPLGDADAICASIDAQVDRSTVQRSLPAQKSSPVREALMPSLGSFALATAS
jgi:hypothetical protein